MNCCYIIHSNKLDRFYIGACHDDLLQRIRSHNDHSYGNNRFTAKADDWKLFLHIECSSYSMATKIEKHIKRMKSRHYILNLARYPEIIEKLKLKYQ